PLFSVNEQGDVTAAGKFIGALATGGIQVESGLATDGMILPLPPGVTEDQVASGEALVQVLVSLRNCEEAAPNHTDLWLAAPLEAWVDLDRRLHCRVRWSTPNGSKVEDHSGVCQYLVIANVSESKSERQDAGAVRQANRSRGGCLHARC